MSIKRVIEKRKKELGLSNAQISKHLRIDASRFNRWFKGKQKMTLLDVLRVMDFLKIDKSKYADFM